MMPVMNGKQLRAKRQQLGLTIKQLALLSGYSWSQVQRMEVGGRDQVVSAKMEAAIAMLSRKKILEVKK